MLNTHVYGPRDSATTVLAVHGITGHGARWRRLADDELPGVRVIAPDLRGHARSPWTPPWNFEQHVADLVTVLEQHGVSAAEPAVAIGHSLGGALVSRLAQAREDLVRAVVLLDPAQGLDPELTLNLAQQTIDHFDFSSPEEARQEKVGGAWAQVPADVVDTEIAEHLVRRDGGRWEWNVSAPAVTALWGELARHPVGPPAQIPTVLLRATRADYVTASQLNAMPAGTDVVDVDSDHMLPQEVPQSVGDHVRALLG